MSQPRHSRDLGELHRSVDLQIRTEFSALLQSLGANCELGKYSDRVTYLYHEVFSKFVGEDTDSADLRKSRAISKWLGIDEGNRKTNHRLYFTDVQWTSKITSQKILRIARSVIAQVLGVVPPLDVLYGTFSNGASTSKKRSPGLVARKFAEKADVTPECWTLLQPVVESCSLWLDLNGAMAEPNFVEGNVMFTVPKNTIIDRVAAKEPDLNMFAQKGVGDHIRARLRKFGIDLNDQSHNRRLAREGSTHRKTCTIDLSSASDSISTTLVCLLLPTDWFYVLDQIRSHKTDIDGTWYECAMFSSMGNGFTFELESLIFYSLVRALCILTRTRGTVSVYGDDIICPSAIYPLLKSVFCFLGFKVNAKKSHVATHFRESCGGHYWQGHDVSPFYIKEPIANQQRLIHFLNRLRKWATMGDSGICDPDIYPFWVKWSRLVDSRFHCGFDVEGIEALVSPGKPRFRLCKVGFDLVHPVGKPTRGAKARNSDLDTGLYLAWQRTCDGRVPQDLLSSYLPGGRPALPFSLVYEAVETSHIRVDTKKFTFKRNRRHFWHTEPPLFLQELNAA